MLITGHAISILVLAMIVDRMFGEPDWLWSRIRHPVAVFGALIDWFDRSFNNAARDDRARQRNGIVAIAILVFGSAAFGLVLSIVLQRFEFGWIGETIIVAVLLAQKSLIDHVQAVADQLRDHGVQAGRKAVAMIVGRNVDRLQEPDISRAAIESAAENFSDGTIAPALWYLVLGLPGLLAYKMVNTADSMVGHRDAKYRQFGFAAARLDDLLNFIPARLSALMIALTAPLQGGSTVYSGQVAMRDASAHASPNAGWPEAAIAGAMDVALGGPRAYGKQTLQAPWLNAAGDRQLTHAHINAAIGLIGSAWLLLLLALLGILLIGL